MLYYLLTILIMPNVFIICHVYYIQISYVSNINNAVAQKTYITLRNSYGQVLSHSYHHIPPTLILCCTPRLLMTFCTCILQLGIASAFLFRYTHLIDMYMYPYRNNKILNDLKTTLSDVNYEKASFVTITFVCYGRATPVDTEVPLPIHFIINIIRRYIFVYFISYLYMDMFHGECCTFLLITKSDLIRKSLIHVFGNERDRVVTRATTCMIDNTIFYIVFANLHYLTYYDDYYVRLCQCILCNSNEPSFYVSLSYSPGYSTIDRFSSILKIISFLTLTCKKYARGVYRGGYQSNKHYNWVNDHTHYVGLNLLLCYLDNCMCLYCNIVCVWSLDIIISMSRLSSILSFICCILYYSVDDLLHKTSTHTLGYQTHKMPRISKTNIMKAQYGKLNMINTSFIVAPVKNNDVLPPSKRAIHSEILGMYRQTL